MDMLLALDTIPRLHNILASFFTWILLAGFVIFPGTFTSLSTSDKINGNHTAAEVLKSIKHVQLLVIAVGVGGETLSYYGPFHDVILTQCPLQTILI
jgi:hypothetical protein